MRKTIQSIEITTQATLRAKGDEVRKDKFDSEMSRLFTIIWISYLFLVRISSGPSDFLE